MHALGCGLRGGVVGIGVAGWAGDEEMASRFVELRRRQAGAFSRTQALEHGITDKVLQRGCRVRQLQRVHTGVYVDFTGPLPWDTRVWAAWLACGPEAALTGETALRQFGVNGNWRDDHIQIALPHSRRVDPRSGVIISRHRDLASQLHGSRVPPIVRLDVALLVTASARSDVSRRAAVLLDACRQRRTTPQRLLAELGSFTKLPGRRVLRQILGDAAEGVHSCSSRPTSDESNALTACRLRSGRSGRRAEVGSSTEMSSTRRTASSSSWTGRRGTRSRPVGGATWPGTTPPRRPAS